MEGPEQIGVDLFDAGEALQIESFEEPFEDGVDVDAPEVAIFVDFGLEFEQKISQGFEIVRNLVVFGEAGVWVSEQHDEEVVGVVKSLDGFIFLFVVVEGHFPQQTNLNAHRVLLAETERVLH